MELKYLIRSLTPEDIPYMHQGFLDGFSDYKIKFHLDRAAFTKKFIIKLNIDFDLSVGVFHEHKLVGFIFHSVNFYEGRKVMYNGGTGISPIHRGKGLVQEMYDFVLPLARKKGIRYSILEVLNDNLKAIQAYERVGFKKGVILKCFKASKLSFKQWSKDISIKHQRHFNPLKYKYFQQALPSYQDVNEQIIYDAENEIMLEAINKNETVGYIIFHEAAARISQIAVRKTDHQQGIGSRLLKEAYWLVKEKPMTVINVREEEEATCKYLLNRGFINEVNQYEMLLTF